MNAINLRTIKALIIMVVSAISLSKIAAATDCSSSFAHQKLVTKVCQLVSQDQLAKLRKVLMDAKTDLTNVYEEVSCDGSTLVEYAGANQATRVKQYILLKSQGARDEINAKSV